LTQLLTLVLMSSLPLSRLVASAKDASAEDVQAINA
jgi:hypothetical protein